MRSVDLALLSILIGLVWLPTARADCPDESWRSEVPTWIASASDIDGLGGSGLVPGDDDGVGGSGFTTGDDDGIGGSGVLGTITGFGSICVNGQSVTYDDDVRVTSLGASGGSDELAVGQVVRIDLVPGAIPVSARAISVVYSVVGTVEEAGGTLTVLGQGIEPIAGAIVPTLEVGQRVVVSGHRRPNGTIVASRVDAAKAELPDVVRGLLDFDADGTIRVARVRVESKVAVSLEAGTAAVAIGRWDRASRTLLEAAVSVEATFDGEVDHVDVEGYVHSSAAGRLSLGEWSFSAVGLEVADAARSSDADALLEPGQRVRVEAARSPNGALEVRRVWIVPERELMEILTREDVERSSSAQQRRRRPHHRQGEVSREFDQNRELLREGSFPRMLPGSERMAPVGPSSERPERLGRDGVPEPLDRVELQERPERVERPERPERPEPPDGMRFRRPRPPRM